MLVCVCLPYEASVNVLAKKNNNILAKMANIQVDLLLFCWCMRSFMMHWFVVMSNLGS